MHKWDHYYLRRAVPFFISPGKKGFLMDLYPPSVVIFRKEFNPGNGAKCAEFGFLATK